jgi:iron complex transport system substrate-binding protein
VSGPNRIVCLTEEPTEVLYALGEQERIVGISGFTVRPPSARREKPKVSAFTSAKIDRILELKPDFVVGFSDIQADIAAELVRAGVEVWIANHRSVAEILDYVRRLVRWSAGREGRRLRGRVAARPRRRRRCGAGRAAAEGLLRGMGRAAHHRHPLGRRAGAHRRRRGHLPERAEKSLARDRILANDEEIIARAPDIVFGSWCGKKFRPEQVAARPGWTNVPAVRDGQLFEIKSPIILQPARRRSPTACAKSPRTSGVGGIRLRHAERRSLPGRRCSSVRACTRSLRTRPGPRSHNGHGRPAHRCSGKLQVGRGVPDDDAASGIDLR